MKKQTLSLAIAVSFLIATAAHANKTWGEELHYTDLEITVVNFTKHTCRRIPHRHDHGYYVTFPKDEIIPGSSDVFTLARQGRGIDLTLIYECGNETIHLRTEEPWNFLASPTINGSIPDHSPNMFANMTIPTFGSWFSDTKSSVTWEIHAINQ